VTPSPGYFSNQFSNSVWFWLNALASDTVSARTMPWMPRAPARAAINAPFSYRPVVAIDPAIGQRKRMLDAS